MATSSREITKYEKRRRPKEIGTPVMTRLQADLLAKLDGWRAAQPEPPPSRPEAIRRLLVQALSGRRRQRPGKKDGTD
jgi:cytochrome c553